MFYYEIIEELKSILKSKSKKRKQQKFNRLMLYLKESPFLSKNIDQMDKRFFNQVVEPLAEEKVLTGVPYGRKVEIGKGGETKLDTGKKTPVKEDYKSLGSKIPKTKSKKGRELKRRLSRLYEYRKDHRGKKKQEKSHYQLKKQSIRYRKAKRKYSVKLKRLLENSPVIEVKKDARAYYDKLYKIKTPDEDSRGDEPITLKYFMRNALKELKEAKK